MEGNKEPKLKMSNRAFRIITIPLIILSLVLGLIIPAVSVKLSDFMNDYLGNGQKKLVQNEENSSLDANYYDDLNDTEDLTAKSYELANQVQEEGTVLLKNNGVLPLAEGSKVTPFGYGFMHPVYGQMTASGSAKWVINPVTPEEGLSDDFKVNKDSIKLMEKAGDPEGLTEAEGTATAGSSNSLMGGDSKIYEYDPSIYDGLNDVSDSTAVVVITRSGQEGSDKKYDGYKDGTPHYLALSSNEKATIQTAKEKCGSVVVLIASSAPMEVGELMSGDLEADAILQVGNVGEKGFSALGPILSGKVNPSGRTVDIWPTDFTKDPTYQNFGEFTYDNATFTAHTIGSPSSANEDGTFDRYFIDYDEGVYLGYKYYETAVVEDDSFVYGTLDQGGAAVEAGAVAYPFGYGLSYTTFEKEITGYNTDGDDIVLTVKVTNTGDVAGKDVVEAYYGAPYTDFDKEMKIEKPVTELAAYTKTGEIAPGESEEVTLSFAKEDMASYCYTRENPDGTMGAYVLENGDYTISINADSHNVIAAETYSNPETIWYDSTNPRSSDEVAASNQFQEMSDYMNSETVCLSRADWKGTFPKRPENNTKTISDQFADSFGIEESFDPETDPNLGNVEGSNVYTESDPEVKDAGLLVSDMRGLDYDDPKWDEFLNQIDYKSSKINQQLVDLMANSNYATNQIQSLGIEETREADGANGIKSVKTDAGMELTATYGYAPLMASTWNTELLYQVGRMFGKEAFATEVSGWYSPAINIHRSPFSGRVYEYYSEDPLLTGKMAAAVVSGAGDSGMFCYIKHFALNDQETNREFFLHTWATEQAAREIYLKAFEIPFKEAQMTINYYDESGNMQTKTMRAATAVMASQNDIGATIAHGNYNLLTNVLRNEWGFRGIVHSDMFVWGGGPSMYDLAFRSGCDTFLTLKMFGNMVDTSSPTAHAVMRRAVHDVSYTLANSACMQKITPGSYRYTTMPTWKKLFTVLDVVLLGLGVFGIVRIIMRAKDDKKHPEKYKHPKKREKKVKASE
ncbi:MAG: glycoside hydrolase family 3 C-terminal domain-containing protein [Pseudobutyrivibrio sp.]|nr:glycoside hydrolase family 3 C-terminal domain-containing protein [Pseudobutyrivibrio sp.]